LETSAKIHEKACLTVHKWAKGVFMKKIIFSALIMGAATLCFAQTATLDIALSGAKTYIEGQLPQGAKVLIIDPAAPGRELGSYAAQELSTRLVNSKRLTVVERGADVMQSINAESGYQLSGEVSDESIQSIGHKTGAEALITGVIRGSGDSYRLNLKITSVMTAELLGQYSESFQVDTVLNALLANSRPAKEKPQWIYEPLTARAKYDTGSGGVSGVSPWYYDAGISNKAASEQLARTRARQNVQQVIAENIASDIKARIDITAFSMFQSAGIEETENRIEAALTNSIKTKVPRYETLEWYIEEGELEGKKYYLAYVLVRFPRKDIITMVEKIEPRNVVNTVITQMKITATNSQKDELIRELEEVRNDALEMIREGAGDR
jgi:hypothetical protein